MKLMEKLGGRGSRREGTGGCCFGWMRRKVERQTVLGARTETPRSREAWLLSSTIRTEREVDKGNRRRGRKWADWNQREQEDAPKLRSEVMLPAMASVNSTHRRLDAEAGPSVTLDQPTQGQEAASMKLVWFCMARSDFYGITDLFSER